MTLFLDPSKTNLSPNDQQIVDDLYAHVRALETVIAKDQDSDWLDRALTDARNAISLEAHAVLASWQSTLGQAVHNQGVDSATLNAAVDQILRRLGIELPGKPAPVEITEPVDLGPVETAPSSPAPPSTAPPSSFAEPSRAGGI